MLISIVPRGYHALTLVEVCQVQHATTVYMSITKHDYNDMTTTTQAVPFHIQPLLSDLYYSKDLLDFSGAGMNLRRALNLS